MMNCHIKYLLKASLHVLVSKLQVDVLTSSLTLKLVPASGMLGQKRTQRLGTHGDYPVAVPDGRHPQHDSCSHRICYC